MAKEVDLLKVDLSPKGWLWLVVALFAIVVAYTVAKFGVDVVKGLFGGSAKSQADWTA